MIIDGRHYPPDWPLISASLKEERNYTCEECAIVQGENPRNNITVHHYDHDTFNNIKSNLFVLCQKCHLRKERQWRAERNHPKRIVAETDWCQLLLPGFIFFDTKIKYSGLLISCASPGLRLEARAT